MRRALRVLLRWRLLSSLEPIIHLERVVHTHGVGFLPLPGGICCVRRDEGGIESAGSVSPIFDSPVTRKEGRLKDRWCQKEYW